MAGEAGASIAVIIGHHQHDVRTLVSPAEVRRKRAEQYQESNKLSFHPSYSELREYSGNRSLAVPAGAAQNRLLRKELLINTDPRGFPDLSVEFGHLVDFCHLLLQRAPVEYHHTSSRQARAVVHDVANLIDRYRLAPIRKLHDRPDSMTFARFALDAKMLS